MTDMPADLDALEALARAALPNWYRQYESSCMALTANAHPAAILALIARVRAAEERAARYGMALAQMPCDTQWQVDYIARALAAPAQEVRE